MPRVARKYIKSNFIHVVTKGIKKEFIFYKEKYKEEPNMKQEEKDETTREEVVIPAGYTPEEYLDVGQECPDEEPEKIVEVKLKYGE